MRSRIVYGSAPCWRAASMAAWTACTVAALTSMVTDVVAGLVRASEDGAVTLGGALVSPAVAVVVAAAVFPTWSTPDTTGPSGDLMAAASLVTIVATRGFPEASTV